MHITTHVKYMAQSFLLNAYMAHNFFQYKKFVQSHLQRKLFKDRENPMMKIGVKLPATKFCPKLLEVKI